MAVDKNLFLYDLAVVAIMKNEAPYVKEWLDYHILAGVDHFYIYDNESTDNFKEVLQPYIDAGIITYTFYPGKCRQMEAYMDAVNKFRFFSRYMTFIDADEFIFPQNNKNIIEVADEIFQNQPNISGLVMNWQVYGSNFQEKADYSKGVLERFTRRAAKTNTTVKTIANPRKIKLFHQPHVPQYFENCQSVNEDGKFVPSFINDPPTVNKIMLNHYHKKSFEEYENKVRHGMADHFKNLRDVKNFTHEQENDIVDDTILRYRDARQLSGGGIINPINYQKCYTSLLKNLSPTFSKTIPKEFLDGKMETFLTCRKLAEHLREKILDDYTGNVFEEMALRAVYKSLFVNANIEDLRLLFSEIPVLLTLDYPVVKDIQKACTNIIPKLMNLFRVNNVWREFNDLEYLLNMLKVLDSSDLPK